MQYNEYAFSINGQKTIIPKNGETLIAVYDKTDEQILTASDILGIRNLYQCRGTSESTARPPVTPSGSEYYLNLFNDLTTPTELFWIKSNGEEVLYNTIKSGDKYTQVTFIGHKWIIKTDPKISFTIGEDPFILVNSNKEIKLSSLISLPNNLSYEFTIINDLENVIKLYWSNEGEEILYFNINKSQKISQKSYTGHQWVMKSANRPDKKFTLGRGLFINQDLVIKASEI